jgi:alginate O-acetyltransferase complex protein AlgI
VTFNSLSFLVFFCVVAAVHWLCPPRYRWAWLLAASVYFCATWAVEYAVLLAISTLVVYALAIWIAGTSDPARRKALLVLGLALGLGLLGTYKYLGFFGESLRALLGSSGLARSIPVFKLLLPVGISFYTFQMLGYLIDVYRARIEPERHPGTLALFLFFFPRLIAGPIERAGHLLPQLHARHDLSSAGIAGGLQLVLWGLFKKVVVADRLAVYVDSVYNNPAGHRGLPVILATCFFAVQIYCDFSGYTNIALGAARVLGYDLTENFRRPYGASSIAEFWRRWHISLTSWFRDYVYIPLGGNRVPRWRWYANLMVVFLLSGLWHGANWTFLLWGGLHGLYYVLEAGTQGVRDVAFQRLHLDRRALRTTLGTLVTLGLVCFAWLFFRANSISDAFLLVDHMARLGASTDLLAPWASGPSGPGLEMALSLGLIALLVALHLLSERPHPAIAAAWQKAQVRWAAYLLLALAIMNLGVGGETPFVYLQF